MSIDPKILEALKQKIKDDHQSDELFKLFEQIINQKIEGNQQNTELINKILENTKIN
jgi:hypothetical protein|tara:strand:+ start:1763 stop:1933 length:171 start_codon:yes stop_codon:yes gene_type:complete